MLNKLIKLSEMSLEEFEEMDFASDEDLDEYDTPIFGFKYQKTNDDNMSKKLGFNCWSEMSKGDYYPSLPTTNELPAGLYEIAYDHNRSSYFLKEHKMRTDELFTLPFKECDAILNDITTFWSRKENYKRYNFLHKRGILLYGAPGNGKSSIINLLIKDIVENRNGVVINIKNEDHVRWYSDFISDFRNIEPERPIIVILEDLDSIVAESSRSVSQVLNLLDGVKQVENIVYLATTNYPEKLEERVKNRPSRFDRRYELSLPDADVRRAYLQAKLKEEDIQGIDLNKWVKDTEGLSLSHLKDLVVSVIVMGFEYEDTLKKYKEMAKDIHSATFKGNKKESIGFNKAN